MVEGVLVVPVCVGDEKKSWVNVREGVVVYLLFIPRDLRELI